MRRYKHIITVLAAACLLAGCMFERETVPGVELDGTVKVRLTVPALTGKAMQTRAPATEEGYGRENYLGDIVVMIFGASSDGSGKLEVCEKFTLASLPPEQTQWENESVLLIENVKNLNQPKNIYVIANWSDYTASKYVAETTTESVLIAELNPFSGLSTDPLVLLMSGRIANYVFSNNANKAIIPMSRQVAKIRMRVEIDQYITDVYGSRLTFGGSAGRIEMRAVNLPNYSFVAQRNPAAAPTVADNSAYAVIHCTYLRGMTIKAGPPQHLVDSCYVFENPVRGATTTALEGATHVILHMPYTLDGIDYTNNYYKIIIDNTANDAVNPYMVLRNYIYDLRVTIKGFGLPEEVVVPEALTAELTIVPWSAIKFTTNLKTDDAGGNGDGTIDPWDPNNNGQGNGGDDIGGSNDPDDNIDETVGTGIIRPWDSNNSGTDL